MASQAFTHRAPWADRWSQPRLEQLLSPLKSHHRRVFDHLMEYVDGLEGAQQSLLWYGPAWKWTIHYTLPVPPTNGHKPTERTTFLYLVPRVESPTVCVPLSESMIAELPLPRLSKFVRDGIKMAKCAVTIHWATWTPSQLAEATQIIDLLKRRHKLSLPAAAEKR
jgi:hypothetical protein